MTFYRFPVAIPARETDLITWIEAQEGSRNALVIKALTLLRDQALTTQAAQAGLEGKVDQILALLQKGVTVRPEGVETSAPPVIKPNILKNILAEIDDD